MATPGSGAYYGLLSRADEVVTLVRPEQAPTREQLLRDETGRLLSGTRCVRSVRDEVKLPAAPKAESRLPYNFGAFMRYTTLASAPAFGLEYTNRAFGGYYRLQVGCAGLRGSSQVCGQAFGELGFILPLR